VITRRTLLQGLGAVSLADLGVALLPASASAQGPIKLGFFGPLTGRLSALGAEARRGAEFAIREFNDAGGLGGRKVELVVYDDRGDRKEAVSVVRKLVESDQVVAFDNGSLSLTSIAAAPAVNEAKVPMVVAYANAVGAVKGQEYVFRWCSVADVQGWVMAHHAVKTKGFKTFAMFVQDEEYGRGIANGVERGIGKLGGKVAYKKLFSPGAVCFALLIGAVLTAATAGAAPSAAASAAAAETVLFMVLLRLSERLGASYHPVQ